MATASDIPDVTSLETRIGTAETDIDNIEAVIPSGATTSNKLATASDVQGNTDKIGDLTQLQTTVKTDLVSAINEVAGGGGGDSGYLPAFFMVKDGHSSDFTDITDLNDETQLVEGTFKIQTSTQNKPTGMGFSFMTITIAGASHNYVHATAIQRISPNDVSADTILWEGFKIKGATPASPWTWKKLVFSTVS